MRLFGPLRRSASASALATAATPVARAVVLVTAATGLAVFALYAGCAGVTSQFNLEQRPDGAYKLSCREPLPRCLQRAEDICLGTRYVVMRAVDHHDYVGSQSTVGEAQLRSSEALFRCGKRGKSWWGPDADPMTMPDPTVAAAATPPPAVPTRACVPGATQQCTGVAACRGGQSCLPDGSGFSACDCGAPRSADGGMVPSESPTAGTTTPAAAPIPTPTPAAPAPASSPFLAPSTPAPRW